MLLQSFRIVSKENYIIIKYNHNQPKSCYKVHLPKPKKGQEWTMATSFTPLRENYRFRRALGHGTFYPSQPANQPAVQALQYRVQYNYYTPMAMRTKLDKSPPRAENEKATVNKLACLAALACRTSHSIPKGAS